MASTPTPKAELTEKEQKVFDSIKEHDKISIEDIAADCWKSKGTGAQTKGSSHVRNSLRKLLRFGLIKKVGRGTYEATGKKLEDVKVPKRSEKPAKAAKVAKPKAAKVAKPKAAKVAKPKATKVAKPKTSKPSAKKAAPKKAEAKKPEAEAPVAAPASEDTVSASA